MIRALHVDRLPVPKIAVVEGSIEQNVRSVSPDGQSITYVDPFHWEVAIAANQFQFFLRVAFDARVERPEA